MHKQYALKHSTFSESSCCTKIVESHTRDCHCSNSLIPNFILWPNCSTCLLSPSTSRKVGSHQWAFSDSSFQAATLLCYWTFLFCVICLLWSFWATLWVLLVVKGLKMKGWVLKRHICGQVSRLLLKDYLLHVCAIPTLRFSDIEVLTNSWTLKCYATILYRGSSGGRNWLKVDK